MKSTNDRAVKNVDLTSNGMNAILEKLLSDQNFMETMLHSLAESGAGMTCDDVSSTLNELYMINIWVICSLV